MWSNSMLPTADWLDTGKKWKERYCLQTIAKGAWVVPLILDKTDEKEQLPTMSLRDISVDKSTRCQALAHEF